VKSYGFGLTKNSEHTNELSVAILKVNWKIESAIVWRRHSSYF
jgi:hypothetical protein